MAGRRHPSIIPLSHDHREALGLAFRLHHPAPPGRVTAMTPASTPESRAQEAVEFFDRHLRPHFRAEEEHLFPFLVEVLGDAPAARDVVDRLCMEHRLFATLRDRLEEILRDGGDPGPTLTQLADVMEAHVRTEERQLFAKFPEGLPEARVTRLAESIQTALRRDRSDGFVGSSTDRPPKG